MSSSTKHFVARYKQSLITLLIVVVLIAVGGGTYGWVRHRNIRGQKLEQQVLAKVGKLMFLPSNETPTLATVTDRTKLTQNSFLAEAKDGDQVLIFIKNQKAIIYRPSANKIVDVGPVITGTDSSPNVTSSIAILNGSGNPDVTQEFVTKLYAKFPNVTIVSKDDAPRVFPKTIVIDMTNKQGALAEQLADSLGYKTGQIPIGINLTGSSQFLIILGQDEL